MNKIFYPIFLLIIILFEGCSYKQPISSQSSIILIKTPAMKFHDTGFVTKYKDNIQLQIFNAGHLVLNLIIYKDKVCKSTFKCQSSKEFNKLYFNRSYKDDFLYNLFRKNKIYFKDKKNKILIKAKKYE